MMQSHSPAQPFSPVIPSTFRREPAPATPDLLDLVRLRVAQLQGRDEEQALHADRLRRAGESQARVARVENWTTSLVFDSRERTALALAELLAEPMPGDNALLPHLLHEAQDLFSRAEIVRLVAAIEEMLESTPPEGRHA